MLIVDFNKYTKGKYSEKMFTEIINEIQEKGRNKIIITLEDIIGYARKILQITTYYNNTSTPIIRIAEDFGITSYKTSSFEEDISGVIYIGGTTKEIYATDKVILVDSKDPYKHQRFVIAHEIAHFLFDCVYDPKYHDGTLLFAETYPKIDHDSPKEFNADRFAAELLMPSELFIKQYNFAMDERNNRQFTLMYLSEFFQTKISSIEKRIGEVLQ